jgi:hypothetical protein
MKQSSFHEDKNGAPLKGDGASMQSFDKRSHNICRPVLQNDCLKRSSNDCHDDDELIVDVVATPVEEHTADNGQVALPAFPLTPAIISSNRIIPTLPSVPILLVPTTRVVKREPSITASNPRPGAYMVSPRIGRHLMKSFLSMSRRFLIITFR